MIAAVLSGLAHANLALAAAVIAVAVARKPVRRAFGARAAYALWLAVPLAAAAVLLPRPEAPTPLSPVAVSVADVFEAAPVAAAAPGLNLSLILFSLWGAGVAAAAGLLAVRQGRFMAEVRQGRAGPAVIGALRPRIVTPSDFEARFAPDERTVILSHEAVHIEAGDARINAVVAGVQCLCWFNPLAHVAAHLMRIDQELACDAAVLGRHPQARKLYAEALLKTQLTTQPLPLGCHWPSAAEHPLKERIVMLKSPLPHRGRRIAGLAVVAVAGCTAAVTAWAAQPGLEPDAAQALVRPGQEVECKPDANRELHDCQVVATPWAKVATAADVAGAFPKYELARGLTADVMLQCAPAGDRLVGCKAKKVYPDQPLPKGSDAAFEAAAVKVASLYRIKPEAKLPNPSFMTIQFRAEPAMPGGPVVGAMPKRAPDALPMPAAARTIAQPVWLEKPSGEDVARLYPAEARKLTKDMQVRAILTCGVADNGRLNNCAVDEMHGNAMSIAVPKGMKGYFGFPEATLELSKLFRMDTLSRDGLKTAGGTVRIPILWIPPGHTQPINYKMAEGGIVAPDAAATISKPVWLERPAVEDLVRLYPAETLARGISADVLLTCRVGSDGRLAACAVTRSEAKGPDGRAPEADMDFGSATLQLAKLFRMNVADPKTAGGIVRLPVRWIPHPVS